MSVCVKKSINLQHFLRMSQELFFTLMIFMALFTLLLYLSQNDQANLQNPKPLEFHESKMGKQ